MSKNFALGGVLVLGLAIAVVVLVVSRSGPRSLPPVDSPVAVDAQELPPVPVAAASIASSAVAPPSSALDSPDGAAARERVTISTLRALVGKDPRAAVEWARAENAADPQGVDAPERTWILVKSLTDLGRFEEARAEAEGMLARFPVSDWSSDVKRHVLSHPPGPPAPAAE